MGWKPGQGVGPQLTQREKLRAKKELKNVGMKFSVDTKYGDDDDDDDEVSILYIWPNVYSRAFLCIRPFIIIINNNNTHS